MESPIFRGKNTKGLSDWMMLFCDQSERPIRQIQGTRQNLKVCQINFVYDDFTEAGKIIACSNWLDEPEYLPVGYKIIGFTVTLDEDDISSLSFILCIC